MAALTVREFHLRRRPAGLPAPDDFALVERVLPDPAPGEVRVRNLFLSVDPYMRGRMSDAKSYAAPYEVGAAMDGGAVGRVEASAHPGFAPGDLVLSMRGWREGFLSDGRGLERLDPSLAPPSAFLGALGMPGLTAYAGLLRIGGLGTGETVLVSGAAGAVGMVACQIAKARDCRVVGVAGSDAKVEWLRGLGVDAAINYSTTPSLRRAIAGAAPDGLDLTFENVGGGHLEAALACSKDFARVVVCGLISQYNATEAGPGLRNVRDILTRRLTVRGFIVSDHRDLLPDFHRDMAAWVAAGRMRWEETVVDGFERMPEAFLGLFSGANLGKMVVRVG
jgi:NADPH-dependent curcumin reductase CurA